MNQPCGKEIKEPKDCPFPVRQCFICCNMEFSLYGEIIRYNTTACREQYLLKQRIINSGLTATERSVPEQAVIDRVNQFISTWDRNSVFITIPDSRQRGDFINYLTMQLCSAGFEVLQVRESEMILAMRNVKGTGIDENGECQELSLVWKWKTAKVLVIQGAALSGPVFHWRKAIKADILKHRDNLKMPTVFIR